MVNYNAHQLVYKYATIFKNDETLTRQQKH